MAISRTHPFLFGIFHSKLHVHRICNYLNHHFLWKPWEPLFLIRTLGAAALMLRRQAGGPPCHQGTAGYHYGYMWLNMAKTMDHIYIYIYPSKNSLSLSLYRLQVSLPELCPQKTMAYYYGYSIWRFRYSWGGTRKSSQMLHHLRIEMYWTPWWFGDPPF